MIDMTAVEQMMKILTEPLGDAAPDIRRFAIDYRQDGQDLNTELVSAVPKGASAQSLVDYIRAHIQNGGGTLSAVWETREGGLPDCLYVRPGFLEKSVHEAGIPVPADPAAATERMGWTLTNAERTPRTTDEQCKAAAKRRRGSGLEAVQTVDEVSKKQATNRR